MSVPIFLENTLRKPIYYVYLFGFHLVQGLWQQISTNCFLGEREGGGGSSRGGRVETDSNTKPETDTN